MQQEHELAEAINVLLSPTADQATRTRADTWLRGFQAGFEAWQAGLALLQNAALSKDVRSVGVTLLTNKLRGGGGGGLAPDQAASLRQAMMVALRDIESGPLRAKCCQAVTLLLGDSHGLGSGPASLVMSEAAQYGLPIDVSLELLGLVPDGSAWLQAAEIERVQLLLLELLDHACSPEKAPFPTALLPASAAPAATSCAYRTCVLDCACKWAAMPSSEGARRAHMSGRSRLLLRPHKRKLRGPPSSMGPVIEPCRAQVARSRLRARASLAHARAAMRGGGCPEEPARTAR